MLQTLILTGVLGVDIENTGHAPALAGHQLRMRVIGTRGEELEIVLMNASQLPVITYAEGVIAHAVSIEQEQADEAGDGELAPVVLLHDHPGIHNIVDEEN